MIADSNDSYQVRKEQMRGICFGGVEAKYKRWSLKPAQWWGCLSLLEVS
jgi:hypothetical protein